MVRAHLTAAVVRAMGEAIFHILCMRSPTQMPGVYASITAFAAVMRRLVLRCWRIPVLNDAHDPRGCVSPSIVAYEWIAKSIPSIGP